MLSLLRRRFGEPTRRVLLAALLLGLAREPALAEPQDGQVFQDWAVRCRSTQENQAIEICAITHAAINAKTQRPVMQIAVAYVDDQAAPLALITVPLFVRLPPGIRIQVDGGAAKTVPYEICNPEGCNARMALDAETMKAFKAGVSGKVVVQVPPGKELEIPFSLKGFTAALASLK